MPGYGTELYGRLVLEDHVIHAGKDGKILFYERLVNGEVVVSKKIYGADKVIPVPLYPVNIPTLFTTYVLVVFKNSLDVAPGEGLTIYVPIPVDIAVYAVKNNSGKEVFSVVDVFSVKKVKYGLYGPVDAGIVARYYKAEYYFKEKDPELGEAIAKVVVRNKTQEWVTVSRILLESNPLSLFYIKGEWKAYTQELNFVITSRKTGSIYYGKPFKDNVVPITDPPHLRQPVIHFKTDMIWGL